MLDYQRDINPIKGNFFSASAPSPNLRTSEIEMMNRQFAPDEDRLLDQAMKVSTFMDQKRNSQLRYQLGLESLQTKRETAQRLRDQDSRLGELASGFQAIVSGEGSTEEKAMELADYKLNNPSIFTTPATNGLFAAASAKLGLEASQKAKADAKAATEVSRLRQYVVGGSPEAARTVAMEDGVITPAEQKSIDESTKFYAGKLGEQRTKDFEAYQKNQFKAQGKRLEATRKLLSGVYEQESGDELAFETAKDGGLSEKHKAALLSTLADQRESITGKDFSVSDARELGLSDVDLINEVDLNNRKASKAYEKAAFGAAMGQQPAQQQSLHQQRLNN